MVESRRARLKARARREGGLGWCEVAGVEGWWRAVPRQRSWPDAVRAGQAQPMAVLAEPTDPFGDRHWIARLAGGAVQLADVGPGYGAGAAVSLLTCGKLVVPLAGDDELSFAVVEAWVAPETWE